MSKQRTSDEMFPLIASWEKSGESQWSFCESVGLSMGVFSYWRKKYQLSFLEEEPVFRELVPSLSTSVEICYPNGVVIRLPSTGSLSVVKSLIELT